MYKWGCKDAHFAGYDQSAEEYTFIRPLFEGDVEVRLSPVQIDKGGQDNRQFDLSAGDYVVHHCGEGRPLRAS